MDKTEQNILILDVRTLEEYKSGHLKGALNIPYDQIPLRMSELEKYKDYIVVVYCRTGSRSAIAAQLFAAAGFKDVRDAPGVALYSYPLVRD